MVREASGRALKIAVGVMMELASPSFLWMMTNVLSPKFQITIIHLFTYLFNYEKNFFLYINNYYNNIIVNYNL